MRLCKFFLQKKSEYTFSNEKLRKGNAFSDVRRDYKVTKVSKVTKDYKDYEVFKVRRDFKSGLRAAFLYRPFG